MRALKPLRLLRNRYRIVSKVGQGGFGTVYQAEDTLLGLVVALKVAQADENAILHLRREARHLACLKHAGIPAYHDLFEEQGRWCLAMEWVDGAHIRVGQSLSVRQVLWIGLQICPILHYLHIRCHQPVIHRDIKPDNLRLSRAYQLYLVDFGISCFPGMNEAAEGSPGYAAPEQWMQGGQITQKADIYALGGTLREFLTGQTPDEQASAKQKPLLARDTGASGHRELADLLENMTAEMPDDRPNICEVWQDLEVLYQGLREEAYVLP